MTKSINSVGIKEIHDFLSKNHKLGGAHFDEDMLRAWAEAAEFQLGEGNPPSIEIKSWDSVHGYAQEYTVSDAGVDDDSVGRISNSKKAANDFLSDIVTFGAREVSPGEYLLS